MMAKDTHPLGKQSGLLDARANRQQQRSDWGNGSDGGDRDQVLSTAVERAGRRLLAREATGTQELADFLLSTGPEEPAPRPPSPNMPQAKVKLSSFVSKVRAMTKSLGNARECPDCDSRGDAHGGTAAGFPHASIRSRSRGALKDSLQRSHDGQSPGPRLRPSLPTLFASRQEHACALSPPTCKGTVGSPGEGNLAYWPNRRRKISDDNLALWHIPLRAQSNKIAGMGVEGNGGVLVKAAMKGMDVDGGGAGTRHGTRGSLRAQSESAPHKQHISLSSPTSPTTVTHLVAMQAPPMPVPLPVTLLSSDALPPAHLTASTTPVAVTAEATEGALTASHASTPTPAATLSKKTTSPRRVTPSKGLHDEQGLQSRPSVEELKTGKIAEGEARQPSLSRGSSSNSILAPSDFSAKTSHSSRHEQGRTPLQVPLPQRGQDRFGLTTISCGPRALKPSISLPELGHLKGIERAADMLLSNVPTSTLLQLSDSSRDKAALASDYWLGRWGKADFCEEADTDAAAANGLTVVMSSDAKASQAHGPDVSPSSSRARLWRAYKETQEGAWLVQSTAQADRVRCRQLAKQCLAILQRLEQQEGGVHESERSRATSLIRDLDDFLAEGQRKTAAGITQT